MHFLLCTILPTDIKETTEHNQDLLLKSLISQMFLLRQIEIFNNIGCSVGDDVKLFWRLLRDFWFFFSGEISLMQES